MSESIAAREDHTKLHTSSKTGPLPPKSFHIAVEGRAAGGDDVLSHVNAATCGRRRRIRRRRDAHLIDLRRLYVRCTRSSPWPDRTQVKVRGGLQNDVQAGRRPNHLPMPRTMLAPRWPYRARPSVLVESPFRVGFATTVICAVIFNIIYELAWTSSP